MPRAYLVAVCRGSSLDQRTNNFTVFELAEQIQAEGIPADLPVEVHAYYEFEEAERGREYDFRAVLVGADGNAVWHSPEFQVVSNTPRYRLRIVGLHVPAAGRLSLVAEIRERGEGAWQRSATAWPLEVERSPV